MAVFPVLKRTLRPRLHKPLVWFVAFTLTLASASAMTACGNEAASSGSASASDGLVIFMPDSAKNLMAQAQKNNLNVQSLKAGSNAALIVQAMLNAPPLKEGTSYFVVINAKQNRLITAGTIDASTEPSKIEETFKKLKELETDGSKLLGKLSPSQGKAVKLVVFSDYQCPFCEQIHTIVEDWKTDFGDKLEVEMAHYPLPMHQQASFAAISAECAREQGKFEAFSKGLFDAQKQLGTPQNAEQTVIQLVQANQLDKDQFKTCVTTQKPAKAIQDDLKLGQYLGVSGTPTMFVNGESFQMADPQTMKDTLKAQIDAVAKTGGKTDAKTDSADAS